MTDESCLLFTGWSDFGCWGNDDSDGFKCGWSFSGLPVVSDSAFTDATFDFISCSAVVFDACSSSTGGKGFGCELNNRCSTLTFGEMIDCVSWNGVSEHHPTSQSDFTCFERGSRGFTSERRTKSSLPRLIIFFSHLASSSLCASVSFLEAS